MLTDKVNTGVLRLMWVGLHPQQQMKKEMPGGTDETASISTEAYVCASVFEANAANQSFHTEGVENNIWVSEYLTKLSCCHDTSCNINWCICASELLTWFCGFTTTLQLNSEGMFGCMNSTWYALTSQITSMNYGKDTFQTETR